MDPSHQKTNSVSVNTNQTPGSSVYSVLCDILESLSLRCLAVGLMYVSGCWKMNPIWIVVAWGVVKYRDQKRLENNFKQEAAKAVAKRNERKVVLSNVDPLPSWVFFTDNERCEWLNKVIRILWPSIKDYIVGELTKFEPSFNDALSKYKKNPNFHFKKIDLGTLTPRVSGVRVYDKGTSHFDWTIMDIHMFFVGDSEISCSMMNNVSFGSNKFEIKGNLRTIFSMPEASFFPGVEIFFLHPPKVDFNLTGFLNIGDIPGISGVIHNTVDSVIASKLVLPNRFVIHYDDRVDLEQLKFPDSEGFLKVSVIEARDLGGIQQLFYSSSKNPDPYVTITFGSKTFTSPTVKSSIDPVFNFTAEFCVDSLIDDTVTISVDDQKQKKHLGKLSLNMQLVKDKIYFNSWIQLEGVISGMVNLHVSYHKLENNPERLTSNDSPAILEVLVDDAKDLENIKNKLFATLSVGDSTQSSRPVPIENPVFRESFIFVVNQLETDKLRIKLINESDQKVLGNTELDIKQLLEAKNMEIINEQAKIKGANETSRLSISMRLRTIKS